MSEIKEFPNGWQYAKLNEIATINPKLPFDKIANDLEVSFLPMKMVEEEINKIHLSEFKKYSEVKKGFTPMTDGDVIFAKITPCMENGKIAVVHSLRNKIAFGSTEFHIFRCNATMINLFLFYFLVQSRVRQDAQHNMTGAVGQRRVPKKYLEELKIPLPPLPEQHRIVAKIEELFSSLDKGIESLKTAQQQLKVYRQAVLKWAFEGKLTNNNAAEGELPEGWKWVTFEDVCIKIGDIDHKMPKQVEGAGFPYLSTKDFSDDLKISFDNAKKISRRDYLNLSKKIKPEKGDIIFPRYGTIGKNVLVDFDKEFLVSYSCAIIKLNQNLVESKYAYHYSLSSKVHDEIKKYTVETTQANIGIASIKRFVFPLPKTLKEQNIIVAEIESRLSVCDKIEESIEQSLKQSEALRQSILKKAFEGKLVHQDPNDEPASALPARIKAEREKNKPENLPRRQARKAKTKKAKS